MQRAYVRTAWAKGAGTLRVVGKHALKNAAIPGVTVLGLQLGGLIGGHGDHRADLLDPRDWGPTWSLAITNRDMPVIMGVTTVFVLVYITTSLLVDIAYGLLNPKVRVA